MSLSQASRSPAALAVTVTNMSQWPLIFLKWNSPLDPRALQLGLLSIRPAGHGLPLRLPVKVVSRQRPPPHGEFVRLEPAESVVQIVVIEDCNSATVAPTGPTSASAAAVADDFLLTPDQLRGRLGPDAPSVSGLRRATVVCHGKWGPVWTGVTECLTVQQRKALHGDTRLSHRGFVSNTIDIVLP